MKTKIFNLSKCLCCFTVVFFYFGQAKSEESLTYGIDFSAYGPNKKPGIKVTNEEVQQRFKIISPYFKAIRTFSVQENEVGNIEKLARKNKLDLFMGAWLGRMNPAEKTSDSNEKEFKAAIDRAGSGNIKAMILGSETLVRGDLTEGQLISYLERFKKVFPEVPVTTADSYDQLLKHPAVVEKCDFVFANIYPYWEGVAIEDGVKFFNDSYLKLKKRFPNKKIVISETGWPSDGKVVGKAVPSPENAKKYFKDIISWSKANKVDVFYFSAFDESWKSAFEGETGKHWGVFNEEGQSKGYNRVFKKGRGIK